MRRSPRRRLPDPARARPRGVLDLPAHTLAERYPTPPFALLRDHLAIRYPGALAREACEDLVRGVYAGRDAWTPNFDGVQFTLGRAYYVHLETDREDEYFAGAAASDAAVERFAPGLPDRLLAMIASVVGAPVVRRPGFCGPGVHVFPAGGWVSHHGGDIHFDIEGLTDEQLAERAPAVTCVLMLQPAAEGGGLQVWDWVWEDETTIEAAEPWMSSEMICYGVGDLVVIDSYRLHQICTSRGDVDRISATAHAVQVGERWEAWF